jgi:hypothetical protein
LPEEEIPAGRRAQITGSQQAENNDIPPGWMKGQGRRQVMRRFTRIRRAFADFVKALFYLVFCA